MLQSNISKGLNVEARRNLNDLSGDVTSWQTPTNPRSQVAHRLWLEPVQENKRTKFSHGQPFPYRSSSSTTRRRISSRRAADSSNNDSFRTEGITGVMEIRPTCRPFDATG